MIVRDTICRVLTLILVEFSLLTHFGNLTFFGSLEVGVCRLEVCLDAATSSEFIDGLINN